MKCTTLYIKELDVDAPHQISEKKRKDYFTSRPSSWCYVKLTAIGTISKGATQQ
jgi:hypothetical protein